MTVQEIFYCRLLRVIASMHEQGAKDSTGVGGCRLFALFLIFSLLWLFGNGERCSGKYPGMQQLEEGLKEM